MPELPEVETILRSLIPHVAGRKIQEAEFYSRLVTRGGLRRTAEALAGATIQALRRHGKQIFFDLDRGVLYAHLGMTGRFLWNAKPGRYTRAMLTLEHGVLLYDDIRQFGRLEFFNRLPDSFARIGPDALTIGFEEFYARLRQHRGQIKPLFLNQSFVGGLGNIYADELLFGARIHPRALVAKLSRKRAVTLHRTMIGLLRKAILHRGSSVSDYVDSMGEPGDFQNSHRVYGRAGNPCPECGGTIRRIVIAQRGTHYCPRCQRF